MLVRMAGRKLGHEVTPETRAKISATLKGRKLGPSKLRGRKRDPDVVKAVAASLRQHVTCTVEGCDRPHCAKGLCGTHYARWRNHGDPTVKTPNPEGSAHPQWKGDEVGYDAVHVRLKQTLPRVCAVCGETAGRLEVALLHTAQDLRTHKSGPYSVTASDYVRMCVRCHRRYDSPKAETRRTIEEALATRRTFQGPTPSGAPGGGRTPGSGHP
jgi:hypothetical protein